MAQKVAWSPSLIARFDKAGFTPAIIKELTETGQVWQFGDLFVVLRSEGYELVWMATLGTGIKQYAKQVLLIAKRAGAKTMRFHCTSEERGILRFWRSYQPTPILDEGLTDAYRIDLGGVNE
ncbi:hypothetical protein [Vibrio atlanticus]|uniref:hypothetical protein n=1 Tax=Vibrio atlanticus TaxID=693153 RepID=UPI00354E5646